MITQATPLPLLEPLAEQLRASARPLADNWAQAHQSFLLLARRPDLQPLLRAQLCDLPESARARLTARSRETTTHFAWCLLDEPGDQFSFWLHEYKPQRDWRQGYADSVHNHRYHFCTTVLRGEYSHERYETRLDPEGQAIVDATLRRRSSCPAGAAGMLLASDFHRIPEAADDTMTLLVKSRPVRGWSLSYDPQSRTSHRHVPVEARWEEVTQRM